MRLQIGDSVMNQRAVREGAPAEVETMNPYEREARYLKQIHTLQSRKRSLLIGLIIAFTVCASYALLRVYVPALFAFVIGGICSHWYYMTQQDIREQQGALEQVRQKAGFASDAGDGKP